MIVTLRLCGACLRLIVACQHMSLAFGWSSIMLPENQAKKCLLHIDHAGVGFYPSKEVSITYRSCMSGILPSVYYMHEWE